jgi:hypothetical protein
MWRYEKDQLDFLADVYSRDKSSFRKKVLYRVSGVEYEAGINFLAVVNLFTIYLYRIDFGPR